MKIEDLDSDYERVVQGAFGIFFDSRRSRRIAQRGVQNAYGIGGGSQITRITQI